MAMYFFGKVIKTLINFLFFSNKYFLDREQLESNCGGFLKGHSSTISRLVMTKSLDYFYSLGLTDNTMIEWKGHINLMKKFHLKKNS